LQLLWRNRKFYRGDVFNHPDDKESLRVDIHQVPKVLQSQVIFPHITALNQNVTDSSYQ
jgi:hypothetical protein